MTCDCGGALVYIDNAWVKYTMSDEEEIVDNYKCVVCDASYTLRVNKEDAEMERQWRSS